MSRCDVASSSHCSGFRLPRPLPGQPAPATGICRTPLPIRQTPSKSAEVYQDLGPLHRTVRKRGARPKFRQRNWLRLAALHREQGKRLRRPNIKSCLCHSHGRCCHVWRYISIAHAVADFLAARRCDIFTGDVAMRCCMMIWDRAV
jgi:hypothetical protein